MKKTFTLLLAFFISFTLHAKKHHPFGHKGVKNLRSAIPSLKNAQVAYLPTSISYDYWDGASWQPSDNAIYEYDINGNVKIETTSSTRKTYSYNENNQITQIIIEDYDYGLVQYINSSKQNYVYNAQGEEYEYTNSSWNGASWVLAGGNRYYNEYDSNGNNTQELFSHYEYGIGWVEDGGYKTDYTYVNNLITVEISYNRSNGAWVEEMKIEWFYDGSNILTHAFEYTHDGNNFVLAARYIDVDWYIWDPVGTVETSYPNNYTYQTYNGSGDMNDGANYTNNEKMMGSYPDGDGGGTPPTTIETYSIWDTDWVNDSRWTWEQKTDYESYLDEMWNGASWLAYAYQKTYSTALLMYELYHNYSAGMIIYAEKSSVSYDSFGNMTEEKNESHTGDENWETSMGSFYSIAYEGGTSKILTRITQNWNIGLNMYENYQQETFNYTPTSIDLTKENKTEVFPTVFNLEINIISAQSGIASFYDLTGSLKFSTPINKGENNISTSTLPSGYYLINVNKQTYKVTKQ